MALRHIDSPEVQRANLKFIRNSMHEPMLERAHEMDLARRWREKKDEGALHELIHAHMRLVVSIASKFRNYGLPMGDLIQEGNIGLMEAANRFDPSRENRFSTYATWWVRASIQDYVLRNWSIVRTGSSAAQKSLFFNLRRLKEKLKNEDDSTQMIADELGVSIRDVNNMSQRMMGPDQSLNSPIVESEDVEIQDFLSDDRPSPEDSIAHIKNIEIRTRWIQDALSSLSSRERAIIAKRQLSDKSMTLDELGVKLGVSKERVRQIEQKALEKLRKNLLGKLHDAGLDDDKSIFFAA